MKAFEKITCEGDIVRHDEQSQGFLVLTGVARDEQEKGGNEEFMLFWT